MSWLSDYRRLTHRYERSCRNYLAFLVSHRTHDDRIAEALDIVTAEVNATPPRSPDGAGPGRCPPEGRL